MAQSDNTWTTILTWTHWKVEENQHGGLFLTPFYPSPLSRERRSQFATVYSTGAVAYDFPGDVPAYVKRAIESYADKKRTTQARAATERVLDMLRGTGNAGVRGRYTVTLTRGDVYHAIKIRHPYGDVKGIGFSGVDFGEYRVDTSQVKSITEE